MGFGNERDEFIVIEVAGGNVEIILSLCCLLKRHFSWWQAIKGMNL